MTFTKGTSNGEDAAFSSAALSGVGIFAEADDSALTIDVTAQVESDLAERPERLDRNQYHLRFADFTHLDHDPTSFF